MNLYYVCKTCISNVAFYLEMSILSGKLKFTSWEGDFGLTRWEFLNKATKLFVNFLRSDEECARFNY